MGGADGLDGTGSETVREGDGLRVMSLIWRNGSCRCETGSVING